MDTAATRPWHLVLWGATGFTGRLVAEALAGGAPEGLRWALGGRDRARLERLRAELGVDAGVVVADAHDPVSLASLARSARVVASTVG
ncbi:MAG: enoyl-ACP reductase, partial [Trueperaceae bacterium]|nr:enoyl-ACP reductase [Trueperaceae bacterium]